jgi:hypothetical protein
MSGAVDIRIEARRVLLDAMHALSAHRAACVLVGAQAIYLHTGNARVALAESTKDSDFAIDPRALRHDPLLEDAMRAAGFTHNPSTSQPGSWISPRGVPVDLMVPEQLAGAGGSRSGRIAPHSDRATRRTAGLEAAVVDHAPMIISALDPKDTRRIEMNVAGPAALLVAKLHKLGERQDAPGRLLDKDAHDVSRLLVATESASTAATYRRPMESELAGGSTRDALTYLDQLFASGPAALGAMMASRAEQLVGAPKTLSASVSILAADLLALV